MTTLWLPPAIRFVLQEEDLWNATLGLSGKLLPASTSNILWSFTPTVMSASETDRFNGPDANYKISHIKPDSCILSAKILHLQNLLFAYCREFNFQALLDADLTVADFNNLPEALHDALYEGMLNWFMCNILTCKPGDIDLQSIQKLSSITSDVLHEMQWFDIQVEWQGMTVSQWNIAMDRSDLMLLIQDFSRQEHTVSARLGEKLQAPVDVVIGSMVITMKELSSVEPGAFVVLAEQDEDVLNLQMQDTIFRLVCTSDGWCCIELKSAERFRPPTSFRRLETSTMKKNIKNAGLSDPLRIAIDFDIGRMMVPLSALSDWREGALISLDVPENKEGVEVSIRANGDLIGSGDLVRIEDRLAVRITRIMV